MVGAEDSEDAFSWQSNEIGWWVQRTDGTYLSNSWFQSPESGLWYYMGADGYMLTNAETPDGCYVDANGVWVQEQSSAEVQGEVSAKTETEDSTAQSDTVFAGTYHFVYADIQEEDILESLKQRTVTVSTPNGVETGKTIIIDGEETVIDEGIDSVVYEGGALMHLSSVL